MNDTENQKNIKMNNRPNQTIVSRKNKNNVSTANNNKIRNKKQKQKLQIFGHNKMRVYN